MNQFLFFSFFCLFITSCNQQPLQTEEIVQQQVIPGELPDPSIIEVDGTYYATGSSNDWAPLYPIYQSTNLTDWKFVNYVFQEKPEWTESSYWAPELFYKDGIFYCYYTAKGKNGISSIGVATTTDISSGFNDRGKLIDWDEEVIDAFVYKEENQLYITWKAYGLNPDKPIQILGSELSDDGLALVGEPFHILTADADNWEEGGIEGQAIVKHAGYLYLFYSGNACCGENCNYKVGVARAKTITGPWEKYNQNPILEGNDTWKCTGHGTAINTSGNWYYLYHAYHTDGFPYVGRSALLSEFRWNKKTGWPVFPTARDSADINKNVIYQPLSDDFTSDRLRHEWRYNVYTNRLLTSLANGYLALSADSSINYPINGFLGVNPQKADFTIQTTIPERSGALSGLAIYTTNEKSFGIGVKRDSVVVWQVNDGSFTALQTESLSSAGEVHLQLTVTDGHRIRASYQIENNRWERVSADDYAGPFIADYLDWWSWGVKAGLFLKQSATTPTTSLFDSFAITYPDSEVIN